MSNIKSYLKETLQSSFWHNQCPVGAQVDIVLSDLPDTYGGKLWIAPSDGWIHFDATNVFEFGIQSNRLFLYHPAVDTKAVRYSTSVPVTKGHDVLFFVNAENINNLFFLSV